MTDRDTVSAPLAPLFAPRSVVVLGASRNPAKLGHRLLQNVKAHGFGGELYAVNPAGEPILGTSTVASVDALPDGVDLALVSLPAPVVPAAVKALAARGVRAAVILSSGFGETDEQGRSAQADILAVARSSGMRLVGPNCMGVYSAPSRLNGTYFWDLPRDLGGISVVSQSGAYGGLIFRQLGARGLGVARFVSIGNQADVDVADVLEYLAGDDATTLVVCFIEALRDGRRFVDVAERATGRKPVVVLKGGRSTAGARAASSHTGSLAGSYDLYRVAFAQAGIVLADETEDFFDAIEALAVAGSRRPSSPDLAVITVSGGPSVVAADTAERIGLRVPPLAEATRRGLHDLLPSFAALGNPVDLTPQVDPDNIAPAARLVLDDPGVAGAIAIDVGLDIAEFGAGIAGAAAITGKPVVACIADAPLVTAEFRAAGIPVLATPERAVRAWRALWSARPQSRERVAATVPLPADVASVLARTRGPLPYRVARQVLEICGVRFCREEIARSSEDAARAADRLGYPVVVKADVDGLIHKTEAGAVVVGVWTAAEVRSACGHLASRTGADRFIVQQHIGPGIELLVGARRDPTFGPVVAVAAGGVLTETIQDVSFRLAPMSRDEATTMLKEGVRERLLAGPRGLPACEPAPLVDTILAVARLIVAAPRIDEIDLNPVIAAGAEAVAVDAMVIVRAPDSEEPS